MESFVEFLWKRSQQAKKNRQSFLEQKKQEFINASSEHERKQLIVELIQLEASHLAEDWVLDQVIKLLKEREKNLDFLKDAFIARGKRDENTEGQKHKMAEDFFLKLEVEALSQEKRISKNESIRQFVLNSDENSLPVTGEDPENSIKQLLKRFDKKMKKLKEGELPRPYYGKDCIEFDKGNELYRIEFYFENVRVDVGGQIHFAEKLTYSHPLPPINTTGAE